MPDFNCGCDASKTLPMLENRISAVLAVLDAVPMPRRTLTVQALIQQIRAVINPPYTDQ